MKCIVHPKVNGVVRELRGSWVCLLFLLFATTAFAGERYAVIVSGVSGGEKYAAQQKAWGVQLATFLTTGFGIPDSNVVILDEENRGSSRSTAENVRRAIGDLRRQLRRDDILLLVLIGHGTFDGTEAKFNLAGPDLNAGEWKAILDGLAGRLVVVNTTASSFPFLEALSSRGRVVITATDSENQRFSTVFPEYLIRALADASSDFDKNGRVSVLEAFEAASAGVRQHYEQRGQLSTERPMLDDDGDGVGREAGAPGNDGAIARTLYLDAEPGSAQAPNEERAGIERRRRALEAQLEELKGRKALMSEDEYQVELEKILVQLATIARQMREGS